MRARVVETAGSLVVFTVLAQAAAGAAALRVLLPWLLPAHETEAALRPVGDALSRAALGLLLVAAAAASLHLARPRAARFALAHADRSWLSREVAFGGLFALVLVADAVLSLLAAPSPAVRAGLAWAAAILGAALVEAMARVYRLRTVPAWDSPATPLAFASTAALLGAATTAVVLALGVGPPDVADPALRALGLLAFAVVVVELLVAGLHLRDLARRGGAAAESARAVLGDRRVLLGVHAVAAVLGGVGLVAATAAGRGTEARPAVLLACALLLASELAGRVLFYASHRRVGL